jgi:hypothetical protein
MTSCMPPRRAKRSVIAESASVALMQLRPNRSWPIVPAAFSVGPMPRLLLRSRRGRLEEVELEQRRVALDARAWAVAALKLRFNCK